MPQLSDTMDSGKILSWSKQEGDAVSRGDVLAEVETDKANLEIEAFHAGTLLKILIPAEETARVGDVIAYIGEAGEEVPAGEAPPAKPVEEPSPAASAPAAAPASAPVSAAAASTAPASSQSGRIKISPLARKIASEHNLDIASLRGSGPNGRIVKRDVEEVIASPTTSARQEPTPERAAPAARPTPTPPSGEGRLLPYSKMRETIARRMQESVTEAPHFYTTTTIHMDQAVELRSVLKEKEEFKGISLNHFVIKAAAYALEHEPRANRAVRDNQIFEPGEINIGVITAIEDGLLIPVIRNTNTLPMRDLVFEARAAIERARAGRPSASDLVGGTFSISNMGMFDVESFTAIINPGQGAVLAVSSIKETPVAENGQVVIRKCMKVTLSVDHRIMDGIISGNFLKFFKEGLENPGLLMM